MPASRQSWVKAWVRPPMSARSEDLAVKVRLGQLLERQLQHLEVIGGGVGAGVAGPQQAASGSPVSSR